MVCWKDHVPALRFWCVALWTIVIGLGQTASAIEWRTLTSFKDVRRLTVINDTLWAATSGGLLAIHDGTEPVTEYTNVDGLGTTDVFDIIMDGNGQKWVAGMGRLVRFGAADSKQYMFIDDNDESIGLTNLADDGDRLWVGATIGLVLFSKTIDDGQIQDSYGRFGGLPDFPRVNDVLLVGDTIWLATSDGLAVADVSNPVLLKSRYNWITFGADLFDNAGVARIVMFDSAFYAATSGGLWRLELTDVDTTITRLDISFGDGFIDLAVVGDSLIFYCESGMGAIVDGTPTLIPTPGLPGAPNTGLSFGGRRWLAVSQKGIYYDSNGTFVEFRRTGLPNNQVSDLTVNRNGVITAAFTWQPAATLLDNLWESYSFYVGERTTLLISDSNGVPWLGTRGNGLWLLGGDTAINYDEQNSTLVGNNDDPPPYPWIVVNGLATDGRYLFAACYRAANGYPVAFADLNNIDDSVNGWDALGSADGIDHTFVVSLDYRNGFVAVGNEFNGVYVCNVGDDPFDRPENSCTHYTENNSFLRSNGIRVVRFAPDGILWVGTNVGLSRYDPGIERFVDVDLPAGVDRDITDLEFDGRGNLWVGTRDGLARFDASTGQFEVYTTANSGLVADQINALSLDQATGDLYIATNNGISLLTSAVERIEFDLDQVVAFPNPFVINSPLDSLAFNFGRPGMVRIFTPAGELVRRMDANSGWFGDNQAGERVASGVYVYLLEDDQGNIKRGKILLVRQ
jgi:hypothetical protein